MFKFNDNGFSQIRLSFFICTDKDISLGSGLVITTDNHDSRNILKYR